MKQHNRKSPWWLVLIMLVSLISTSTAPWVEAATAFKAGTYTAKEAGHAGDVEVTVTLSDDAITDITATHQETKGLGDTAIESLIDKIKSSQSLAVDTVSGATESSEALIKAVTKALQEAGVDVEALKTKSAENAEAHNDGLTFKAGEYQGTAKGHNGDIEVTITLTEDQIKDIQVKHDETKGLGDTAIADMVEKIKASQSLAVDTVSGATESSSAVKEAIIQALTAGGANVNALKERQFKANEQEPIEKTADVIVVGGGGGGLAAAVSAAESGASVILIDKSVALGGNTLRSGGGFNTADPERQQSAKITDTLMAELKGYLEDDPAKYGDYSETFKTLQGQIKEYIDSGSDALFDSPELHAIHTLIGGTRKDLQGEEIKPEFELVNVMTQNSLDTLHWLEKHGVKFTDKTNTILGALWPRSHFLEAGIGIGYIEPLTEAAKADGVEILLETRGQHLMMEGDKVVGVQAETASGTPVTLHANKGVVLATGGFGANPEMRRDANTYWEDIPLEMKTTNTTGATGDGIAMGDEAGAANVGMGFIQLMPSSHPDTGSLGGGVWGTAESQVFINKEGKRFVNEYSERDTLAAAALKQPDQLFYIISDSITAEITDKNTNLWGDDVDKLVETKSIFRADTLEDLAKQIDIDPAVLVAEIEKYNSYVDSGKDPDFNKTNFGAKIEVGPFYATPRSPSVHHTMGGLKINTKTQVLNAEGQAIPGLFAVGEVSGGIHGGNRLGGNAITDIFVFGRIAGQEVAK